MAEQALSGLQVVEYGDFISASYCTKLLADLGAEVIKVEEPGLGDESRQHGPFLNDIPHPERSGLFLYLNANKLGVTLDAKTPTGRGILLELLKRADVLVENHPRREMKRLGLYYTALKKVNPSLIVTSITPFGQTGPYKDYKAYPLNIYHAGGDGYLLPTGGEYMERAPVKAGGLFGDGACGLSAAVATLASVYARRLLRVGQHIDMSQQESLASLQRIVMSQYLNEGIVANRANQGFPYGGITPCKDGYVQIRLIQDSHWRALVQLMGNPPWMKEERFQDHTSRTLNRDELNARIWEWTIDHTKEDLYNLGQERGCPVGPYYTAEDVLNCEQIRARGFFAEVEHPSAGKFEYPSAPYIFSKTPWRAVRSAPLLGQHNEEIYCRRLGYSKRDLVRMAGAGII